MTANPFAALLAKIGRYSHDCDEPHLVPEPDGKWLDRDEVLAALAAAAPDDLAEAGKLLERLNGRTVKRLAANWKEGRKCPECDADATRQKCMWEMGGACPRHDPSNYEPSPYDTVPDRDCKEAADLITALLARLAAQEAVNRAQVEVIEKQADTIIRINARAEAAETALAAERAKTTKLVEEATKILEQIDKSDGMPISTIGLCAAVEEASQ